MGFNTFDVPTMIAVSDPWVDETKDKPLLTGQPLTAGLVPIIEKAHNGLLQMRVTPSENAAAAEALAARAAELDADHDDRYRGLHAVLTGWASISNEKRRATIESLRDKLLPDGLAGVQRTYLAEAGNVELALSQLTPEDEATLKSIVVDGTDLLVRFNEWAAVGRMLGDVERERARLSEHSENRITAADVRTARFKWIRAVNALTALLELASDVPEEMRLRILQPLRAAESKFARKRSRVDPTEGVDPTETDDEPLVDAAASDQS